MIITGLDPGKGGALVSLFEDGSTIVNRVPLFKAEDATVKKGANKGKPTKAAPKIDYRGWANDWRMQLEFIGPDVFIVEQVGAWTGQGVKSIWNFAHATGFAFALIMYVDVPIHFAPPNVWKLRLGLLNMDERATIARAIELIPSLASHLTRVKDHDVAEAGLMAYYGRMTIAAK